MMNDVVPVWLKPTRNAWGFLVGSRAVNLLATASKRSRCHHAGTMAGSCGDYQLHLDGLLYNTDWIKQTLDVPSIHSIPPGCRTPIFIRSTRGKVDERRACCGKSDLRNAIDPQNLAALSQASLIHIKGEYDEEALTKPL